MSRTKSLLLAAIPVLLAFVIVCAIHQFSNRSSSEPPILYSAEQGVERAWHDGSIRVEGGSGQSEDDPLVLRMDYPQLMQQFSLDHIISFYLRQNVPDSTFSKVINIYDGSNIRPLYALYDNADGVECILWIDVRYGVDWDLWIKAIVLGIGFMAGNLVYGLCRRHKE